MKRPLRFLASLLAGVSLGMLFAPKKGKELRNQLSKSTDKMGDFGKQLLAAAQDASGEVQKLIKGKEVQDLIASGKVQVDDFLKIVKKKGNELSAQAKKEIMNITKEFGVSLPLKKKTTRKTTKKKTGKAK